MRKSRAQHVKTPTAFHMQRQSEIPTHAGADSGESANQEPWDSAQSGKSGEQVSDDHRALSHVMMVANTTIVRIDYVPVPEVSSQLSSVGTIIIALDVGGWRTLAALTPTDLQAASAQLCARGCRNCHRDARYGELMPLQSHEEKLGKQL